VATIGFPDPTWRLLRVRIGKFWLGDLAAGQWRNLTGAEIYLAIPNSGKNPV
jgi:16S rRNA U516 pseudouridylate synthase RsuA-like enzyme